MAKTQRKTPEDLGFQVHKLTESHFENPSPKTLVEFLGESGVSPGRTLRRPGNHPAESVFRELLVGSGVQPTAAVVDDLVSPPAPSYCVHLCDDPLPTGQVVWGCFDPHVPAALVWYLLAIGSVQPGDVIWCYGDAVSEVDAATIRRVVDLRLC